MVPGVYRGVNSAVQRGAYSPFSEGRAERIATACSFTPDSEPLRGMNWDEMKYGGMV